MQEALIGIVGVALGYVATIFFVRYRNTDEETISFKGDISTVS
jgi:hypothetical protein